MDKKVHSVFSTHEKKGSKNTNNKGSNQGKRNRNNTSYERNGRETGYITQMRSTLSDLIRNPCANCGGTDHFRGDIKCKRPSFATRKIRESNAAQARDNTDNEEADRSNGNFRTSSKRSKGNGAM